ncbi:hypothetical protein Scep_016909 [Stephania cephalantha]|uniref:Uncharacterized protein n=1 Tax=Stephania cephalantha TaxID=152367 RepID=A0AAP0IQD3_9MAGN
MNWDTTKDSPVHAVLVRTTSQKPHQLEYLLRMFFEEYCLNVAIDSEECSQISSNEHLGSLQAPGISHDASEEEIWGFGWDTHSKLYSVYLVSVTQLGKGVINEEYEEMKEKGKIMKELTKWKKYTKNYHKGSKKELNFCTSGSHQFLDASESLDKSVDTIKDQ